jgi:hypothetical protein
VDAGKDHPILVERPDSNPAAPPATPLPQVPNGRKHPVSPQVVSPALLVADPEADTTTAELKRLAEQQLPEVVFRKLSNPHLQLSVDEQLECLTGCIAVGAMRALQARNCGVVMVIGNTGAGKSTFVNFLHGCGMEIFRPKGNQKAIRVKPDSSVTELMRIGHTNQSMTFIPGIATDSDFTYMDCPGFLDNRGPEINIANAVNIKQAIHAAKDVVVIIVIHYESLRLDRGRGLRELVAILQSLFGNIGRLRTHAVAVMLGVSQVPLMDGDGDDLSLEMVSELLDDTAGMGESEASVVAALRGSLFIFDPTGRRSGVLGWSSRAEVVA